MSFRSRYLKVVFLFLVLFIAIQQLYSLFYQDDVDYASRTIRNQTEVNIEFLQELYKDYEPIPPTRPGCLSFHSKLLPKHMSGGLFKDILYRYFQFHAEQMKGVDLTRLSTIKRDTKFLVADVTIGAGLGNAMLTFTSSFMVAIMMKRVIIFRHDQDLTQLFCDFIPQSSVYILDIPGQVYGNKPWVDWNKLSNMDTSSIIKLDKILLDLTCWPPLKKSSFYTDASLYFKIENARWLKLMSEQYFIPGLYLNPVFKVFMQAMFPDQIVYKSLFQQIYYPSNEVFDMIVNIYNKFDRAKQFVIGIQLRSLVNKYEDVVTILRRCTQDLVVPKNKNVAFLVASLYPDASGLVKETLAKDRDSVIVQPSKLGVQNFEIGQLKNAVAEMFSTGMTDRLLISTRSTFGYQMQAVHESRAFYLSINGGLNNETCYQSSTIDPCFQLANIDLYGKSEKDLPNLGLVQCQDYKHPTTSVSLSMKE